MYLIKDTEEKSVQDSWKIITSPYKFQPCNYQLMRMIPWKRIKEKIMFTVTTTKICHWQTGIS